MKLEGKTALVTGSGRNIGRATILAMAAEGANVVVNARTNQAEADAVAEEARALGVGAISVLADVADRAQVDAMVARALDEFGRIDVLVSNAAIRPHKPFLEVTYEDWRRVVGVVLEGAFFCAQAVLPSMLENGGGRIIFISGDGAFAGSATRAHVSAPKMGLTGLGARAGVRVRGAGHHRQRRLPGRDRHDAGPVVVSGGRQSQRGREPHTRTASGQAGGDRGDVPVPRVRGGRVHHRPDDPRERGRGIFLVAGVDN